MRHPKLPSLQHLARQWAPTAEKVARNIEAVSLHPPSFTYAPLHELVRDFLLFDKSLEEVMRGVDANVRQPLAHKNYSEILPLIYRHFAGVRPDFVNDVGQHYLPLSRELNIPFSPPILYGLNGELVLPWFSFWRSAPLGGDNLRLFMTLAKAILAQDADLDEARFYIIDLSATKPKAPRSINIVRLEQVDLLADDQVQRMLNIFLEGYKLAVFRLESRAAQNSSNSQPGTDQQQGSLW